MNTTLVQILSLYRVELDALSLNIDECFMEDLVYEIIESNKTYTKQKNITCSVEVDSELSWFTDKDLLFLLLNDVLVNAIRYGASEIKISTVVENEYLCIAVEDNGPGYPQSMLDMSDAAMKSLSVNEGRTGLGLFFARMIAQTHKNKDRQGSIKLSNNSVTGGSIFKVLLP
jgi:K+-sensing histidine kinase KdpD